MYISLGNSMQLREKSIIGIFDIDNTSASKITRDFLKQAERNGEVITVCDDLPKSFLLSQEYGMNHVCLLQPNSRTIEKRLSKNLKRSGTAAVTGIDE